MLNWVVLVAAFVSSVPAPQPRPFAVQLSSGASGEARTLLADGRVLVTGGMIDGSPSSAVVIEDLATGRRTTLSSRLERARAWHTATVLPDGTIAIVGGIGTNGTVASDVEFFNPKTGAFESRPLPLRARARHSATVLTDGRVLLVGGQESDGTPLASADLWDPSTNQIQRFDAALVAPRFGHTARLDAEGGVRLEGGATAGSPAPSAELFVPEAGQFISLGNVPPDPEIGYLAGSLPEHGAVDVAIPKRIAVRFSRPLLPASVTPTSVVLASEGASIPLALTVAEGGRLVFAIPMDPLDAGAVYTLTAVNLIDDRGHEIVGTVTFTTAGPEQPRPERVQDGEDWLPGPDSRGTWRTGRPDSPWVQLPPLKAAPGVTAIAGQVLALNGRPLPDIEISLGDARTLTDRTGRFLLQRVPRGQGVLVIDGTLAAPSRDFGVYQVRVYVRPGETNVLPYTSWLPRIDHAHAARIGSPTIAEVVVTTPFIPGLELHIPKGAVIRDRAGKPIDEITLTPVPVDRPPFPLPTGVQVPVYFTIQPGGAFIETPGSAWPRGARVVYPNYTSERPGTRMNFWNYDPEDRGWHVYGHGLVNAAARQVVPDDGVQIYRFTGTMINFGPSPPGTGPAPWWLGFGDPVDPATGLFVLQKTDLYLPDILPLALTRTYRPNDTAVRPFGIGATHPYAIFLWSAQQYQEADLVLPHGGRVHYVRTSPGTSYTDAVFEHTTSQTVFYKSQITHSSTGWNLTLKDGTVYFFGENAPLQWIRDRFGNQVRLTWSSIDSFGNGYGNLVRVTSPNGRYLNFTYDTSGRITSVTDNIGRTVQYTYDAGGRLWKVTDPAGGITEYTYDASHRMLTLKDARGIVYLTNEYDGNGRVIRQTQADATTYQFAYTLDGAGRVAQTDITNPRGYVDRLTFNTSGYPTSHVEAVGTAQERTTTFARRTDNLLESTTDPLNRRTDYSYDANGNMTAVTRLASTPDAVTTSFTYEPTFSQIASVTDPLSHVTSFGYDSQGRLTTVTDPLNQQTTLAYNPAAQPVSVTDPMNQTTQFSYYMGDLVGVTDALGRITTQFVDAAGRLVRLTNPPGQTTSFEYNIVNLLTKVTDPLGGQTQFAYDGNGNLLTLTDAANHTTTWTYSTMDRVATRIDPLVRQESFTYDAAGNLVTWTDRKSQATTFSYDALDRLTFTGYGTTGTPPTYESTTTRTYDAGDRLTQVADSTGSTITRGYDLLNRLTSETTAEGSIAYTYDAAGRRATMTVAGQPVVSYTYDNADRLTGITQSPSSVAFTYDSANRRASVTLPNAIVMEYGYDAASQLTGITYKVGTNTLGNLTYTYDLAGSRTAIGGTWARTNLPAALASATYDAANQIVQFGGVNFAYDANGNLTNDGARTYTWNARNDLVGLAGPVPASFTYDGFGRRRVRTVSGTTTGFLHDGLNAVQELAGGLPSVTILTGLGLDEHFVRADGTGVSYLLTDAVASTLALADSSAIVQTEYTYGPFGATTVVGSATNNSYAFTGRELDPSGLYSLRARYYNPLVGRFISEDPVRSASGRNVHAYADNNPVQKIDPLGLWALFGGVSLDVFFWRGGEASAGGYAGRNTGCSGNWGGYKSSGAGNGVNVGVGVQGGFVLGPFAGEFVNRTVSLGPFSITSHHDPSSGAFVGLSGGVGYSAFYAGASRSRTGTDCDDHDDDNDRDGNKNRDGGGNGGAGAGGGPGGGKNMKPGRKPRS